MKIRLRILAALALLAVAGACGKDDPTQVHPAPPSYEVNDSLHDGIQSDTTCRGGVLGSGGGKQGC
jgi:hypothetical protein